MLWARAAQHEKLPKTNHKCKGGSDLMYCIIECIFTRHNDTSSKWKSIYVIKFKCGMCVHEGESGWQNYKEGIEGL